MLLVLVDSDTVSTQEMRDTLNTESIMGGPVEVISDEKLENRGFPLDEETHKLMSLAIKASVYLLEHEEAYFTKEPKVKRKNKYKSPKWNF